MIDTRQNFLNPLLDAIEELQKNTDMLKMDLNALTSATDEIHQSVAREQKSPSTPHKNARIVRFMNTCLENGMKIDEAIIKTANHCSENPDRVQVVYDINAHMDKIIKTRATWLMVVKLKKAGLTAKEIARIVGYSEKYIYTLLKRIDKSFT